MKNGSSTISLDDLIKAALTGTPYNQQRLGNEARRYARRLSKAYGKDFPEDLHDEVFGQAFVELFEGGAQALAQRNGKALFRRAVLAAIRAVRASYTAPGRRTRSSSKESGDFVAPEHVGQIATQRELERCIVDDGSGGSIDFDRFGDPAAGAFQQQMEHRLDVEKILRAAPTPVATALRLIYLNEESVDAVASELNISRFTLHRRITAFCASWRVAA